MRARPFSPLTFSATTAVVLCGLLATPALAQDDTTVANVSTDLTAVAVEGAAAAAAQAAYDDALLSLGAATAARTAAEAELADLAAREAGLTASIAGETDVRKAAAEALVLARSQMQAAAVSAYVVSTDHNEVTEVFDIDSTVEVGVVGTYSDTVREDRYRATEAAAAEVARSSRAIDNDQRERVRVRARTVEVTTARDRAAADEATLTVELAGRAVERDRARATSRVRGADFSLVALDAYWRAAQGEAADCGIEWWALAGISRVEGRHGTYGGARLLASGDLSRPIIGIPLTGTGGTAYIGDSDDGALDGDATYDRAVGPMQFIPETWSRFARDGDGDGDSDPQNLYDAAASAAAYLCQGRRLDTEEGLRAGFFSYNHSESYVDTVLEHAYDYRELRIPDPT